MLDLVLGVHTLLREELVPVGDDQPEVAGTRLVDARIEDLGEDAVTDGEPDQARGIGGRAKGGADTVLGAGGPTRFVAGLAGRRSRLAILSGRAAMPQTLRDTANRRTRLPIRFRL